MHNLFATPHHGTPAPGHNFLHREIWQRLPRPLRQQALLTASSALAPRPNAQARAALPIIVVGALRAASGLGQSARHCYNAIKAAGLPVYGIDLTKALMQAEDYLEFEFNDARSLEGPGTLIVHVNAPLMPLAMVKLGGWVVRQKHVVGYWHWELSSVPPDWRVGIPFVHQIWAPSRFTAAAIDPIAAGRPVRVVPHPVALHQKKPLQRRVDSGRPFTLLMIFNAASSIERKNPLSTIRAFQAASAGCPEMELIIKTSNMSSSMNGFENDNSIKSSTRNVTVVNRIMSSAEIDELYMQANAVISLHRSEGFGLTLAEAMLRGLPVIATDWSGNVDFLSKATGIPIGYRLVSAQDSQGTYHYPNLQWAEANIDEATTAIQRLYRNPALCYKFGKSAAQFATRTWSIEAYVESIQRHLAL
jgi:glycosyltransferase involved in cell wall biosynthesis